MNLSLSNLKRVAPAPVLALAVLAAACGGGTTTAAANTSSAGGAPASGSSGGANGTSNAPPGVSGTVAAVNGTSLEVQGPSGQVTVNVTGSTVIIQTVAATATDLAVGQCVSATGTKSSSGAVAARAVTINEIASANGTCAGRFGRGGGFGAGRFRGGARAGGAAGGSAAGNTTRSTLSAAQRARFANLGISTGKVTTISGNTVDVQVPPPPTTTTGASSPATNRRRITPAGSFTFNSSTTFTKTESATASTLAVNQCVTAFGSSNSTGAVTATRIAIRPPVNGSCSTGRGGGRGFFGRGFGGGGGAGAGG